MPLKPLTRSLLTLATVAVAIVLVAALWHAYVLAPWTRDARVSAHVVRIAPEVSGTVVDVAVIDNQRVAKGDVLYRIDPQRFALAVEQAQAQVAATAEAMRQKRDEAQRRTGLDDLVPREDIQRSNRAVAIAQAEYRKALAALDVAKLDLARTTLRSPVDGYVTQLRLRHGDYAVEGKPGISVLDAHSFWITGYFEETKLRRIATGAPATIRLMGFEPLLGGHVTSIGRGIADENGTLDELGLPAVNPTFSWVRLAQRIPVRIEIDQVPAGVLLAAGMTCSVEVGERGRERTPRGRLASWLHAWM
ncbi:biotin/lipoyl-binding protein [Burkholderia stabilis]|uniref:biotin/lipoyl-binding protein n=1 Tax=Burkholderia stabilis TaxID=95485 RepID=UPI001591278D|nr:HlyD family secretion protein [Burkholderia stabilis]